MWTGFGHCYFAVNLLAYPWFVFPRKAFLLNARLGWRTLVNLIECLRLSCFSPNDVMLPSGFKVILRCLNYSVLNHAFYVTEHHRITQASNLEGIICWCVFPDRKMILRVCLDVCWLHPMCVHNEETQFSQKSERCLAFTEKLTFLAYVGVKIYLIEFKICLVLN